MHSSRAWHTEVEGFPECYSSERLATTPLISLKEILFKTLSLQWQAQRLMPHSYEISLRTPTLRTKKGNFHFAVLPTGHHLLNLYSSPA